MNQEAERVLTQLGLSENEARVYLAALSLGPTTALKISRQSGIKRSTVYANLSSLTDKGLINIQASGFKRRFAVENPERLESLLESRRAQLKGILPKLCAEFYNVRESESFIKHYHGLEGVKTVYDRFLEELNPGDYYYAISNQEKLFDLDASFFEQFSEKRRQLDVDFRLILQDTPHARTYRQAERTAKRIFKFLPKEREINTCIITLPHKQILIQLVQPPMVMVVENPHVIATSKLQFEMMWEALPEPAAQSG